MAGTGALRLGPAARRFVSPERWTDGYPGPVAYSRELDVLLDWASKRNYLNRFLPNIEAKNTKRDEALNELRLAYLFDHTGFPLVRLDPPGADTRIGEYLLNSPERANVFVELKSRGWESELSKEEIAAGRQHQPKYRNQVEGGAVGNWDPVQRCIESNKTYPKFTNNQPNLLIIADDLKVPLHFSLIHVQSALFGTAPPYPRDGYFNSNRFENIGGLGIFGSSSSGAGLEYEFIIYPNPYALPATRLPQSLLDKFNETFTYSVKGTDPRRPAPVL
jgi:hypothetical protein